MTHAGGAKGKELLAAVKAAGARMMEYPKVTRFSERLDFIRTEFRRAGRRADANRFVCKLYVQRIHVRFRINRERSDAKLLAGANHAQRDLTAIGD